MDAEKEPPLKDTIHTVTGIISALSSLYGRLGRIFGDNPESSIPYLRRIGFGRCCFGYMDFW